MLVLANESTWTGTGTGTGTFPDAKCGRGDLDPERAMGVAISKRLHAFLTPVSTSVRSLINLAYDSFPSLIDSNDGSSKLLKLLPYVLYLNSILYEYHTHWYSIHRVRFDSKFENLYPIYIGSILCPDDITSDEFVRLLMPALNWLFKNTMTKPNGKVVEGIFGETFRS